MKIINTVKKYVFFYLLFLYLHTNTLAQQLQKIADYTIRDGLQSNAVTGIFKDANGFFWIQSYNTLQRWNGKYFFSEPSFINPDTAKKIAQLKQFIPVRTDVEQNYFLVDNDSRLYTAKHLGLVTQTFPNTLQTGLELDTLNNYFKTHRNDSAYYFLNKRNYCTYKTKDGFYLVDYNRGLLYLSKKSRITYIGEYKHKATDYCYLLLGDKLMFYERTTGYYKILQNERVLYAGKLPVEVPFKKQYIGLNQSLSNTKHITFANGVLRKFELQADNSVIATDLLVLKDYEKYSSFYFDESNNTLYTGTLTTGFSSHQLSNNNFRYIENKATENYAYTHQIVNNTLMSNIDFYLKYQKKDYPSWNWLLTSAFCPINKTDYLYVYENHIFAIKANTVLNQKIEISPHPLYRFVTTDSVVYLLRETINKYYPATNAYKAANLKEWPTFGKPIYAIAKTTKPNLIYALIGNELQALNMHTHSSTTLATGISGEPRSIDADSINKGLFISTKYNGCYYFKDNQLIKLPLLFNNKPFNAHYVLQDKEGDYWLPTNEGLYCMFKKDFTNFLYGKTTTITFKKFGKEDGILNEEFNGGFQNAGLLFKDSIYMGTMAGTVVFHPSIKYMHKSIEGRLVLDYIKLDSTDITNTENIELPANFRQLNIKADYPFVYTNGNLAYRLLGSNDTAWHNLNNSGILEIKNLESGTYTIEIRPTTDYTKLLKLLFRVKPYWHNTWWARLVFFGLFLWGCYIIFMWRWHTLKNKNLELINSSRTKFFAAIVHDLRSPLNSYIGLADDIKYLIQKRDFDSIDKLGNSMDEKSRNLTLLVSNVLNWSNAAQGLHKLKIETLAVNNILDEIVPIYIDIATHRDINIAINIDENATIKTDKNAFSLIVRNLIDNAIKHSANGASIAVNYYKKSTKNVFEISNAYEPKQLVALEEISHIFKSEVAPEPHTQHLGLGIASVYNSCKLLGATIEVILNNNVAIFKIILPA